LLAGCATQVGAVGDDPSEGEAPEGDAPSTGPLPAPMTRDAATPTAADAGFSSPPSDKGGNPTPTPKAPPAPTPTPIPTAPPPGTGGSADPFDAAREFCVQRINQYRGTLSLPALTRAAHAEACVDKQAQYDSSVSTAHGAFSKCGEFAQNECPGWGGSLTAALPGCLAAMWSEGPGGGHYENMLGDYRSLGCGIFQSGTSVTIVQDFGR